MKFSEKWLREWVNPPLDTQQLVQQLTMAGLEVDSCAPVAKVFSGVVVAKIVSVEPHPEADRLSYCQVIFNENEAPLPIVCGASNVYPGMKVALARIGAVLPDGLTIKKAKLRNVISEGMLCSSTELGMTESSEGILELPTDAPLGEDIRSYLKLEDNAIEVDLTPNRGDCWSILGLAREVAALNQLEVQQPTMTSVEPDVKDTFPVKVSAADACPRYVGRIIRGINLNATSPLWLQQRLMRSGIRSIDPVVDVTNYVMLELGQPLHAFDLSQISGSINVRMAHPNETLTLLDDQSITLDESCLVIADQQKPLALAGVMGGKHSGINDKTVDLFLESAFFKPHTIIGKARRFALSSESAQRFERGVDPQLQIKAMQRATQLLVDIVGGTVGPVIEVVDQHQLPQSNSILLRYPRVKRVLGIEVAASDISSYLQRLGMSVVKQQDDWQVTTPSHRFDLSTEVDLVEEIARLHGYNNIQGQLPTATLRMPTIPHGVISNHSLNAILVERNYHEIISYSFVDPELQQLIDPESAKLKLINPLSSELSEMRSTLWPGLLATLIYNQYRQQARIQLYERGLRFIIDENKQLLQQPVIAGIAVGTVYPEQWGIASRSIDFFDVKSDVEALLSLSGNPGQFIFQSAQHSALHPGQSAQILKHGKNIGWIGALHPKLEDQLDLVGPVFLFELQSQYLEPVVFTPYKAVSKFPSIRRDLSFIIDKKISTQEIISKIMEVKNDILQNVQLFDVFEGKGIAENKKSIAIAFNLQHATRTLIDDEVNTFMQQVMSTLQDSFTIELRE